MDFTNNVRGGCSSRITRRLLSIVRETATEIYGGQDDAKAVVTLATGAFEGNRVQVADRTAVIEQDAAEAGVESAKACIDNMTGG